MKPIPILVLASDPHHIQKISALNAGASGYLGKPYELEECLAQAQSLIELYIALNTMDERCYTLVFGVDLVIDPIRHQATLKGEPMELTRKEFDLVFQFDPDLAGGISLLEQIETPELLQALKDAKERERYIFLNRVLEERSFSQLASELGITYKATTHAYYRFVERLRRQLGGDEK